MMSHESVSSLKRLWYPAEEPCPKLTLRYFSLLPSFLDLEAALAFCAEFGDAEIFLP
jgi:hypothetical protein